MRSGILECASKPIALPTTIAPALMRVPVIMYINYFNC